MKELKEFWRIMEKDVRDEHFTEKEYVIYGILAPVALFALMCVAGWLETI